MSAGRQMDEATFEALLARALQVPVPAMDAPAAGATAAAVARPRRRPFRPVWLAAAAGLLIAVGLAFNLGRQTAFIGSGDLPLDVVTHIRHEEASLARTARAVDPEELASILHQGGAELGPMENTVSYAQLCPFRGEMVAHLVVQGEGGPVTVLLLPEEQVDAPMPVHEGGFHGTIAPLASGGAIAVIGEGDADIAEIQSKVAAALEWRL